MFSQEHLRKSLWKAALLSTNSPLDLLYGKTHIQSDYLHFDFAFTARHTTNSFLIICCILFTVHIYTYSMKNRGPVLHYFHTFLDKVIFSRFNQNSALVVLAKLIIDQALFAPLFTSLYFYLIVLMKDEKLKSTTRKLQYELWPIMKSNWTVWIPANFIGYYLVPLELRVLWNNIVGLFWTAYLIGRVADGSQARRNWE